MGAVTRQYVRLGCTSGIEVCSTVPMESTTEELGTMTLDDYRRLADSFAGRANSHDDITPTVKAPETLGDSYTPDMIGRRAITRGDEAGIIVGPTNDPARCTFHPDPLHGNDPAKIETLTAQIRHLTLETPVNTGD